MTQTLVRVGTLLLAVSILLTGHGLALTVLPMRGEWLGWSTALIGYTGSAYFLGFVAGCLVIPGIVAQVAHIRTFMVMAALATVAVLGVGVFDQFAVWLLLRFAVGFAFSGLYMVIESWLSEAAPPERRGSVLAVYSMISLLAMVLGQSLLGLSEPGDLKLLMGGGLLMALAIIPIGLSRMTAPHAIPRTRFSTRVLARSSRVAVVCVFFSGLVTGALWAVGPLVGKAFGLDTAAVGFMMATAIVGGALAQIPVGRLSDLTDRRVVIAGLFTLGALVSIGGWLLSATSPFMLYTSMFFIGATCIPVYALCIATASDRTELSLIEVASGILIMNSLGSIFGPILVSPVMSAMGPHGFFLFSLVSLSLGGLFAIHRISVIERPKRHEQRFQSLPRTSFVAAELAEEGHGVDGGAEPETSDTVAPPN